MDPSPTPPNAFSPQHQTAPSALRAQVRLAVPEDATSTIAVSPPTGVGTTRVVALPIPSCPAVLPPQQETPPPVRTTHVCTLPEAISTASVTPETRTGTVLLPVVVPFANCPDALSPQHQTSPATVNAQVWLPPGATFRMAGVIPETNTGVRRSTVELSPSRPAPFCPQQYNRRSERRAQVWFAPAQRSITLVMPMPTGEGRLTSELSPI